MNETEMGWLARHLGHDIHVHKHFYRLPDTTLELAVVRNLLMAVDEGRAHLFKGKNPPDIKLVGKKNSLKDCQHILGNGQKSNNKQSSSKVLNLRRSINLILIK